MGRRCALTTKGPHVNVTRTLLWGMRGFPEGLNAGFPEKIPDSP